MQYILRVAHVDDAMFYGVNKDEILYLIKTADSFVNNKKKQVFVPRN